MLAVVRKVKEYDWNWSLSVQNRWRSPGLPLVGLPSLLVWLSFHLAFLHPLSTRVSALNNCEDRGWTTSARQDSCPLKVPSLSQTQLLQYRLLVHGTKKKEISVPQLYHSPLWALKLGKRLFLQLLVNVPHNAQLMHDVSQLGSGTPLDYQTHKRVLYNGATILVYRWMKAIRINVFR